MSPWSARKNLLACVIVQAKFIHSHVVQGDRLTAGCLSAGGFWLNVFSTVPRWQKPQKPMKWSMELQNRGRVPKSPVPFLPRRQTAKPRAAFRPRLLLPSQPKPRRSPQPRWRASYTASTSGRHTARKPPAGKVLDA